MDRQHRFRRRAGLYCRQQTTRVTTCTLPLQNPPICLLIAALAGAALLTGCGQKGPLYLPDDSTQAQKKKSTDTPTAP